METIVNLRVDYKAAELFDFYTQKTGKDISKMFEIYMLNIIHNELFGMKNPFTVPMTIEEYKRKLDEGLLAYENGEYITHEELLKEVETW